MQHWLKLSATLLLTLIIIGCEQPNTSQELPEKDKRTTVEMMTNYGTMVIELYNETPLHRDNFTNLAKNNAYDSLLFHRVINTFMIQAGNPNSKTLLPTDTLGDGDAPYVVQAEFNDSLFHKKGVIAAARDNNPEKASSAMQFYIVQGKVFNDSLLAIAEERITKNKAVDYFKDTTKQSALLDSLLSAMNNGRFQQYNTLRDSIFSIVKDKPDFNRYVIPENQREVYKTIGGTPHLDQHYTVYGEVVKGLEVIDSIAAVETSPSARPIKEVRILSVSVLDK